MIKNSFLVGLQSLGDLFLVHSNLCFSFIIKNKLKSVDNFVKIDLQGGGSF